VASNLLSGRRMLKFIMKRRVLKWINEYRFYEQSQEPQQKQRGDSLEAAFARSGGGQK
jgi:hypothetical protein